MKIPLILVTYGITQKLCTWEEEGVHKLPLFNEPALASLFVESFNTHMGEMLEDKEAPQIQICENPRYALDMLRVIGMIAPEAIIVYNPIPIGEDAYEAVEKIAGQFQDIATVVNKEYSLEETTEIFQKLVDEL
jgi:hypothetical protein